MGRIYSCFIESVIFPDTTSTLINLSNPIVNHFFYVVDHTVEKPPDIYLNFSSQCKPVHPFLDSDIRKYRFNNCNPLRIDPPSFFDSIFLTISFEIFLFESLIKIEKYLEEASVIEYSHSTYWDGEQNPASR